MHRTTVSARPAAAFALALAASLVVPGTAFAATTDPTTTPVTTTPPSTSTTSGTSSTGTTTGTSTTSGPTASGSTTSPSSTTAPPTTASTTTSSTTTAAPKVRARSASPSASVDTAAGKTVPFGLASGAGSARVAGGTAEQAGYAAGFMVRTLAGNEDHYNYPGGESFDGGNTVDAILGLDGAGLGRTEADAAFAYLRKNVGGYIGTDYSSLYAGPTGKVLVAVVAHGGDPRDVGPKHVDLLAQLQSSLGAAEPGRYSDLPVTGCGYDPCDYSNTIGQALDIIGVGRATGSAPKEAVDYLLAQQCTDGGFRGELAAAGGACTSDLDATAFAAQAVIGLRGADDAAATRALAFLAGKQAANGGFLNGDGQYNANTAGVAAQAFAAGGRRAELALAQGFLASLQLDCRADESLRGGVAFTAADRAILTSTPTTDKQKTAFDDAVDRALRATPQATLGLAGGDLLGVSVDGASTAVPAEDCPTAPTSTTSTATTSTAPAGQTGSTTAAAAPFVTPAASAAPGALAFTGADVALTALLGLALLLLGAAALVLARRKGAHA